MSKKRTTKLSIVMGICIVILTLCLSLVLTACSDKNGKPDDITASSLSDFTLSSDNKTILGLSKQNVTCVIIPAGIENIGESAFSGQDSIKSVTMSDSVTSIDERAFEGCYALMSVTISSGMTEIGDYAFSDCYQLVEVYNKSSLNIVKGSEDNGYVAYYAKDVYTSDFVSKLSTTNDGYTIYTNENVKSLIGYTGTKTQLTIPNDITQINNGAFFNCQSLTNVTIGDHVTSIGDCAFYGCIGLTSITIPDSVLSIGEWAFADCDGITRVILGENLTTISDAAFCACKGLTSIIIPQNVTSIGDGAFACCYRLVEVYNKSNLDMTEGSLDNGHVTHYAKAVYNSEYTSKLSKTEDGYLIYTDGSEKSLIGYTDAETQLTFPRTITEINKYAFFGYVELASITIPNSVTSIGISAFESCNELTDIHFDGTKEDWDAIEKGEAWDWDAGDYTLHCTDGNYNKYGNKIN